MKQSYSVIFFKDHTSGVVSKRSSPYPRPSRFSSILSAKSFILLSFTFKSMIHFDLIFVKGVRSVYRIIFLFCLCVCPVVPVLFDEKTTYSLLYCLCSFVKCQLTVSMWVYFCSIDLFVYSLIKPYCLDCCCFIISLVSLPIILSILCRLFWVFCLSI